MQKRGEAMQMISLEQELKQNAYPGRGIVIVVSYTHLTLPTTSRV